MDLVESADPTRTVVQALEDDGVVWDPLGPNGYTVELGTPYILRSAYACARAIEVVGALRNAIVSVYDSQDNLLGNETADGQGRATVYLTRPLIKDEWIYATQFGNGVVSPRSLTRRVEEYEGPLPKPRVADDVWACSRLIGATGVVPGAKLILEKDTSGNVIAEAWPTAKYAEQNSWWPTPHNDLPLSSLPTQVRVSQTYCPNMPNEMVGPASDWRSVQEAPSPMPPLKEPSIQIEGLDYFSVQGAYVGANVRFYNGSYTYMGGLHAVYPNMNVYGLGVVEAGMDVRITQQLCGAESSAAYVDILPEEYLGARVHAPEIVTPICPGARVFEVKTSVPGGQVMVYTSNQGYIARVAGSTSGSMVVLPWWAALQEDEEIEAVQVFPGVSSPYYSPVGYAQVGGGANVEVSGASNFDYWNHDGYYSKTGFSRHESRGPIIELRCCASCDSGWPDDNNIGQCLLDDLRTATVQISYRGEPVEVVTLHEEYHGYFAGQWDWYQINRDVDGSWPPPENIQYRSNVGYEVTVLDSPCDSGNSSFSAAPFDVLNVIEEPNYDDVTLPEEAYLKVGAISVWGEGDKTEVVSPGKNISVTAGGFDSDGLSRLEILGDVHRLTSSYFVEAGYGASSDPNYDVAPVPSQLVLYNKIDYIDPYEDITLSSEAINYNYGSAYSGQITIVGAHPNPSISSVSKSQVYADEVFSISGSHLYYETLETRVYFEMQVGASVLTASQVMAVNDSSLSQLSNVSIPQLMEDKSGTVEIWVVTKNKSGVEEKQSSRKSIELKAYREQGPFSNFELAEFKQNKFSHCTSNVEPGAITGVTLHPGGTSGSSYDFKIEVSSNGRGFFNNAGYNLDGLPNGGFVGFVVGPRCRTIAILSYTKSLFPEEDVKRYNMTFLHFPSAGSVISRYHGVSDVYRYTMLSPPTKVAEPVPRLFRVSMSLDETIVSVGTPSAGTSSGGTNIQYAGRIRDVLTDRVSTNATGMCLTTSMCSWETVINGGEVVLKLDGVQVTKLDGVEGF